MSQDAIIRSQNRAAALTRWAHERDRSQATQPARSAFMERFRREVDPTGSLPPEEREKRAQAALRAHMTRLRVARMKKQQAAATRPTEAV